MLLSKSGNVRFIFVPNLDKDQKLDKRLTKCLQEAQRPKILTACLSFINGIYLHFLTVCETKKPIIELLTAHHVERRKESPLFIFLARGDISPTLPPSIAIIHCGVTATKDRRKRLEGSLAFSAPPEVNILRASFQGCPRHSAGGLDLGCGSDVVHVCLCPRLCHMGTAATSGKPGSVFLGLPCPYNRLAWSQPPRPTFFCLLYINVDVIID